MSTLTGFW